MANAPSMRFRNFGGIHQFMVTDDNDLSRIDSLDPARWAATSAPLHDLQCDPGFLAALDPDGTGRIRVSQLLAARNWLFERLARRGRLRERTEVLILDDLDGKEAGAALRAAAAQVIAKLSLADASRVSLADVRAYRGGFQKTLENGDGIVPPEVATDADVAQLIKDIVATTGGAKDAGGSDGCGQAELDKFVERAKAWLAWRERGAGAVPWGDETAAAAGIVAALDAKITEFFLHCDLLRQEAQQAESLRLKEDELRALRGKDAGAIEKYLHDSPLALPVSTGALVLAASLNPAWRDQLDELKAKVLARALPGEKELTRASWQKVKATFEAWSAWQKDKPAEPFDALGEARVRAILEGPLTGRLVELIGIDKGAAPGLERVAELEKLILLSRWLIDLVNNFVNFSAIYRPDEQALIETGSLVIDGRRLDFCVKVTDRGGHKAVAAESLIYLVYAAISDKDGAVAYEIVAPVTAGSRGRLRVGKRGIFIDIAGKEWDAQVVEIVEHAISVKEAAFAPFRRVSQMIGKKIEDWFGDAQKAQEGALTSQAEQGVAGAQSASESAVKDAAAGKAPPAPAAAAPEKKSGLDVNSLILGGGIALGGIATVFGAIFGLLASLTGWLAIAGVVLAVLALSALLGWLKLRRRDMSLVMEAGGWALNVQMKVNRRIGRVFTYTPDLPPGAVKDRTDALQTKEDGGSGGIILLVVLTLLLAGAGYVYFRGMPAFLKPEAPAAAPAAPAPAAPATAPAN